jgi:hypothetical protein
MHRSPVRVVVGALAMLATLGAGLFALGLVLGWGSTVVGYEFGSSPAGRKAAEAGVRDVA